MNLVNFRRSSVAPALHKEAWRPDQQFGEFEELYTIGGACQRLFGCADRSLPQRGTVLTANREHRFPEGRIFDPPIGSSLSFRGS